MEVLAHLLELAGLGQDRLQLRWISSSEGQLFADYITDLTALVHGLGPVDRDQLKLPLAAIERALESVSLRWLMGMERQLTERENVFHEKLDPESYHEVLKRSATVEYHKALLFEALQEGPKTVRQLADSTHLPVYTISLRLNDLERAGLADIAGHEGHDPSFRVMTA
jgi:F420-non-reducing hydrogenase iron-sulfur subunit